MYEPSPIARRLAALQDLGFTRIDAVAPVETEVVRVDGRTEKVTCARPAMGTRVSVQALARTRDRAEEAIGRAFEEMDRLIGIFSRYDRASALAHLNDSGHIDGHPPELGDVVTRALDYHGASGGAFDVSVAPVLDLFRRRRDTPAAVLPHEAEVREALALVGADRIRVTPRRIDFGRDGMAITLDGIAKGYIVDAIAGVLRLHGVKQFLVNAGGDIRTAGRKERRLPWTVAVRHPTDDAYPDVIHVTDGAVATSGSYEVFFDREQQFHHIVNAGTGRSPTDCRSVSVVAPTAMAADALATAVFVLGPRDGMAFVERLRGTACLIVTRDGASLRSRRWKSAGITPGTEVEA